MPIFAVNIQDTIPVVADSKERAEEIARDIASGSGAQASAWDTFLCGNGIIKAELLTEISEVPGWAHIDIPFGDFEGDTDLGAHLNYRRQSVMVKQVGARTECPFCHHMMKNKYLVDHMAESHGYIAQ